jgi:formyl-CoA transferase
MIDVALYESVFNVMESLLPEHSVFDAIRQPAGSSLPGIAPSNAYRCADGKFALIAGNGDSIFRRLMAAIGRDDLGGDPALAHNEGRVLQVERIDEAIREWTGRYSLDEVLDVLNQARIPAEQDLRYWRYRFGPSLSGARHAARCRAGRRHAGQAPGILPS